MTPVSSLASVVLEATSHGPVSVEPDDFHHAAVTIDHQQRRFDPIQQDLVKVLSAYAGCAGIDRYAHAFNAAYQPVLTSWTRGVNRAVNLLSDIAFGIEESAFNHWRADTASAPGTNGDERPPWTPLHSGGPMIPANLPTPSLVGKPFITLPGDWADAIPMGVVARLRACGTAYNTADNGVVDLTTACYNSLKGLFANNTSDDLNALQTYWRRIGGGGDTAILTCLSDGATGLARACYDYADWSNDAQNTVLQATLTYLLEGSIVVAGELLLALATDGLSTLPEVFGLAAEAGQIESLTHHITTALADDGLPARHAAIIDRLRTLDTTLNAAIGTTPNPTVTSTSAAGVTDAAAMRQAERIGDIASDGTSPTAMVDQRLAQLPAGVRTQVREAISRAASGTERFPRRDGKVFQNFNKSNGESPLPEKPKGYYRAWTAAAQSEGKSVPHRVIIGGDQAHPDVVYYWDHDNGYTVIYP